MKRPLAHLPLRKRAELVHIVSVIREKAPETEMIILFGSYARDDWVEDDLTVEGNTTYEYRSDFDILVIVKNKSAAAKLDFWNEVEEKAGQHPVQTFVRLIVHDIKFVNRRLKKGHYFFTDIKKEGVILYDSKKFLLAEPKQLRAKERLDQAKADFEHWFSVANGACRQYKHAMDDGDYKWAAYMLHQAAENFYGTALLVHTNYRPKRHDIKELSKMASEQDPGFSKAFPLGTQQEKDRFELLRKAYVGARYEPDYTISTKELKYLARCVEILRDQTQTICEKKMESFV